jgi:ATP-dependent DNA helicase RecG
MDFAAALSILHTPPAGSSVQQLEDRSHPAWQRLKFDELLAQQLSMRQFRNERIQLIAPPLHSQGPLLHTLKTQLPFALTSAQQRVMAEISEDMARSHPMQRLLQGDVGSGKTIVAALACTQAIDSAYQAVLLAPTEILASQHFAKIATLLQPLGIQSAWLTGSQKNGNVKRRFSPLQMDLHNWRLVLTPYWKTP